MPCAKMVAQRRKPAHCRPNIWLRKTVTRDNFWSIVREHAVRDRESYLDAWSGTGNVAVLTQTNAEIVRFNAFKGVTFKRYLESDKEGVRLALLCAEGWYESLADAQAGKEKKYATHMFRRVNELRMKLFGRTRLEAMLADCEKFVIVPIHKVQARIQSGLSPTEFLTTQDQR